MGLQILNKSTPKTKIKYMWKNLLVSATALGDAPEKEPTLLKNQRLEIQKIAEIVFSKKISELLYNFKFLVPR